MASVTIRYTLSETGRKASLLSGGDGKAEQSVTVPHDSPLFAAALAEASVNPDGAAILNITKYFDPEWDSVPTAEQLVAWPAARRAEKAAKEEEQKAKKWADTLAVLNLRQTRTIELYALGEAKISYRVADWPYDADESVKTSPEAVAWEAELATEQVTAIAARDAATKAEEEKRAAEKAAKEAARLAFRAELGLTGDEQVYRIEQGCLATVPVWEGQSRGKNWLAVISLNPKSPGGLERDFQPKCKGDLYYDAACLTPGTPVEFGADYYSGGGRKNATRWYGYVTRRLTYRPGTEEYREYLALVKCDNGKAAVKAAAKVPPPPPVRTDSEGATVPESPEVNAAVRRVNGDS